MNDKCYQIIYDEIGIDQDLIPLGTIAIESIRKAREILMEIIQQYDKITKVLSNTDKLEIYSKVLDKSSEFYEYIPMVQNRAGVIPALVDDSIKFFMKHLDFLENSDFVARIISGSNYQHKHINPLDYCFNAIDVPIEIIAPDTEIFKLIQSYMKKSNEKDKIVNIFGIRRNRKATNYKNTQLLWHGTKTENLLSILKDGLRISPILASKIGSMFGSGLYFANKYSKSI